MLFTVLDTGGTFPSLLNLANLLQQGAGQTVIAMGLVFVLLIGEIDLAAGTASGLAAAVLALHQVSNGNLLGAMGTTVFVAFVGDHGLGGRTRGVAADLGRRGLRRPWGWC